MPLYRVEFVDHSENVYGVEHFEHASDEEARKAAQRMNAPRIGAGFDVWEGDRLVHRHRN